MTAITFDTLRFVHRLKESGIPEQQAEAISAAFKDATGEAELATKGDLREMEYRVAGDLKLLKWMLAALLAVNGAVLVKLLF
ncbi:MAG: Protein of unknown function (DUF1640) [Candidatus Kentron sp. G]|nr:MAG: Protein of unknown function (DUF1640) [Candidatus Kentron sp. G]VFN00103.1 MAG: Protein of unknown function (DUF1640) [Candidatus Kentron sp. G]VFN02841.1 MAG: Protein of unknown function (DUF1640) [Candidatus Kentron sp. G]